MKLYLRYFLPVLSIIIFLYGCTTKPRAIKLPPVTEGWHKSSAVKNAYIVQKKDTLYSIARAFGVDYRYLADINNIKHPYKLHYGQRLYIIPSTKYIKHQLKPNTGFEHNINDAKSLLGWVWPASGKVVAIFNNKLGGNKGIDISGIYGQFILACNNGKVVYTGTGIRSYGKLIIIKHNDDYLSAYAYNKNMLVTEGQEIKTGQKIATMGKNNDGKTVLHFEIRRFGKPVNPLLYLPET